MRQNTLVKRHTFGKCINRDVGTSFQRVNVSGNNTKLSLEEAEEINCDENTKFNIDHHKDNIIGNIYLMLT